MVRRTARTRTRPRTAPRTARKSPARRRAPKKGAPIGLLLWTALVLSIVVVFLFNRAAIRDVLERTELVEVLQRSMEEAVGRDDPADVPPAAPVVMRQPREPAAPGTEPTPGPDSSSQRSPLAGPAVPEVGATAPEDVTGGSDPERDVVEVAPAGAAPTGTVEFSAPSPATQEQRHPPPVTPGVAVEPPTPRSLPVRQLRLFFATVDQAGVISVTGVTRTADDSGAPLTDTIVNLLAGPDPDELGRGLITLIPPAVTLNRVYIRERVAYIDVSESFRFNRLGREGLDAQLRQVVFSATQFPNVEQVQILINGARVDYLGSEGMFIGEPIGPATLQ